MQICAFTFPFRSHVIGEDNKDKKILLLEFYLYVTADEIDATGPLRNNILNGKIGNFHVANIFDVVEGMFFNSFLILLTPCFLVNILFFAG